MFPHPLLMARIGASYSDSIIQELEQEVLSWQHYSQGLEKRLDILTQEYQELAFNACRLLEHKRSVEDEKNHLLEENDRLSKIISDLRSRPQHLDRY